MKINTAGIELIKDRESCCLIAYLCPAGIWTIGYGHTGPEVHQGWKIDQGEANALLQSDLIRFDAAVQRDCPDASAAQHSAMVDLAYNIGVEAFARSSVARLHNAGRYAEAAQAFALWNKAAGKVLPGLVSRRAAEAAMYLSDCAVESIPNADGEKPSSSSRVMNGGKIAVAGTGITLAKQLGVGDALQSIGGDTFQQVADALQPVASYSTAITVAITLITLGGVGWAMWARYQMRREGTA